MFTKQSRGYCGAVVLSLALLLSGCGDKLPKDLESYILYEDQVQSLNVALEDEELGKHLAEMDTPETRAEEEKNKKEDEPDASSSEASSSSQPATSDPAASSAGDVPADGAAYAYTKLEETGDIVSRYAAFLTGADVGFSVSDGQGAEAEPPDYTQAQGEVFMTRPSVVEDHLLQVSVSWEEEAIYITLTRPEGAAQPEEEPEPENMTNDDLINYLKGLSPARLGLTGQSMNDYQLYPQDGAVRVNGVPCRKVQVYHLRIPDDGDQDEEFNEIAGIYLITGDCQHIYRLENGTVQEMPAV